MDAAPAMFIDLAVRPQDPDRGLRAGRRDASAPATAERTAGRPSRFAVRTRREAVAAPRAGFAAFTLALALAGCEHSHTIRRPALDEGGEKQVMVLDQVVLDRFERDRLRYRSAIGRLRADRTSGRLEGQPVEVVALDPDAFEPSVRVRAPRGTMDHARQTVTLAGGVWVEDNAGRQMETEAMDYDLLRERLVATSTVTLRGKNFVARGASLLGELGEDRLDVGGPVRSRVEPVIRPRARPRLGGRAPRTPRAPAPTPNPQ